MREIAGDRLSPDWLVAETGLSPEAAGQLHAYLSEGRRVLGAIPTQETLVLERFFDESGGMQLVLHAPFGSRINKAWCLALRKRFCRQFNFELQAAATEDALLLSLGTAALVPARRRVPLSPSRDDPRRAGAGVSGRAGLQDAVAVEHDHLARRAARPRRAAHGAAAAADAGRRSDGRGVPRCRSLPREHSWRPPDSRSSAGQPDRARLPAGGDGFRGPAARARTNPRRRAAARWRAIRPNRRYSLTTS